MHRALHAKLSTGRYIIYVANVFLILSLWLYFFITTYPIQIGNKQDSNIHILCNWLNTWPTKTPPSCVLFGEPFRFFLNSLYCCMEAYPLNITHRDDERWVMMNLFFLK
ncbi:hypothetical protein ACJX0J_020147 [Zea mays]